MKCLGRNMDDHCCNLGAAGVCKYLEENTQEGYRWVCGLRHELSSWDAVLQDKRYKKDVQPFLLEHDPTGKLNCRDYPSKDMPCNYCGAGHGNH